MIAWAFHNPVQIRFGLGSRSRLADAISERRVLVVCSRRGRQQMESDIFLNQALAGAASLTWVDEITSNPGLQETQAEIDKLSGKQMDLIVSFGGGSAMDAGKALAAALGPKAATRDLETLINDPTRHLTGTCLPTIAIATTSGTGAEVTPFATIWDHVEKKKLSLASQALLPRLAIIDPELTYSLPRDPTLSSGLDALNQAFESVWNRNRTPVTLALAGQAIRLALAALPRLERDLSDHIARSDIAQASLLAGLAISQTRTAICHAMSYPLTAHLGLAHGWACGATMAVVANQAFTADSELFNIVAQSAGVSSGTALLSALQNCLQSLGVTQIAAAAGSADQILSLITEMLTPGRSDNFILPVTPELLSDIITASFLSREP